MKFSVSHYPYMLANLAWNKGVLFKSSFFFFSEFLSCCFCLSTFFHRFWFTVFPPFRTGRMQRGQNLEFGMPFFHEKPWYSTIKTEAVHIYKDEGSFAPERSHLKILCKSRVMGTKISDLCVHACKLMISQLLQAAFSCRPNFDIWVSWAIQTLALSQVT